MDIRRGLEKARSVGTVVRLQREKFEDGWVNGFVTDLGLDYFAIEVISDSIRLNGFNCFRYSDITNCLIPAPHEVFLKKALTARNIARKKSPNFDISSLQNLLKSAGNAFPLITIHDDEENNCHIGKVLDVSDVEVRLLEISPDATWDDRPTPYYLDEITRVDFGGSYEEALFLVAASH